MIRNPVLPGFHPDPSVLRVGDDYFVATSTFEWFPGVRVHHSRDLANWQPLGGILDDTRLLDLTGCPDSAGVWAPNLSYADGLFHLVYSNVSTYLGGFTDCPNYLTTAPSIDGPWSDPILLHARGFDASLFHDGDESWLLNLVHDWRPGHGGSAGLEATRYDRSTRSLVGDPIRLQLPPAATWIEGPNLYRVGDWYYLFTADGGTGYDHQVTVSRSRSLAGPYERDPNGPLITAKHDPLLPLQKAGHGSLVQTPTGQWYLAYLVARPHGVHGKCILGRETALAPVEWTADGWPVVPGGEPALEVAGLTAGSEPEPVEPVDVDRFDGPSLSPAWSALRRPATPDWVAVHDSRLRIRGGRSPQSLMQPSLVARRVTAARSALEATVHFAPAAFQHLAGITAYYNSRNWHFLYLTADEQAGRVLRVATCDRGVVTVHSPAVPAADGGLRLGVDIDGGELRFRYASAGDWQEIGPTLDATILSDEHATQVEGGQILGLGFTGAFVGMWVWDLNGHGHPAEFADAAYTAGLPA